MKVVRFLFCLFEANNLRNYRMNLFEISGKLSIGL